MYQSQFYISKDSVLVFCIIFLTFILFSKYLRRFYYVCQLPGPRAFPIIGNAWNFKGTHAEVTINALALTEQHAPLYRIWLGPVPIIVAAGPESAQVILTKCLEKSSLMIKGASQLLGDPILISKLPKWKRNRSIIIKGLTPIIIKSYFNVFVEKSEILITKLKSELSSEDRVNESFNVFDHVSKASMDSVCGSILGVDVNSQQSESTYLKAVQSAFHLLFERAFHVWKHPDCIYNLTKESKIFKKNVNEIWGMSSKIIAEKRKTKNLTVLDENGFEKNPFKKPLLEFLIDITEKIPGFSDEQLRDEVSLTILAAYETTASAISYTILSLAAEKQIQNKVYQELYNVFGNSERPVTLDDLSKLTYMEMVIKETMRYFPTIPMIAREVTQDIKIGNNFIPKGCTCVILICHIHRDKNIWKNPTVFDPERFTPENIKNRHPFAYLPFSAGPRNCIGIKHAMMFMKTLLATILRKYEFSTHLKLNELNFCIDLSWKLVEGHYVTITQRKTNECKSNNL